MTRDERVKILQTWCDIHPCDSKLCRNYNLCQQYPSGGWGKQPDEVIDKAYAALLEDRVAVNDLYKDYIVTPQCEINLKKAEDQKAKADYGKEELTLVPRRIIHDICAIRMYGNKKYPEGGPDNWKQVEIERYRNATFRHFLAYLDDPQGKDKESGFPHLWHLACNIAFLCEMEDKT